MAFEIEGERYDIGTPEAYRAVQEVFSKKSL